MGTSTNVKRFTELFLFCSKELVFLSLTSKYSFLPKQELCVPMEHTEDNSFFEVVYYLCFKWKSFRIKMPKLASFRRP